MLTRFRCAAFTLIELLVVIAIIGLISGILLAAVQRVRGAAVAGHCANNLRHIGLALHQYHDTMRTLPPGCSYRNGSDPQPYMSWMTRLLPYLEQATLWRQALAAYKQTKFFEDPPHTSILGHYVAVFACPADYRSRVPWDYGRFQVAFTDYLGVEGTDMNRHDGVLYIDSRVRWADIADGTSNTLIAGERPPSSDHSLGWWYAAWGQLKTGSAGMVLGVRELCEHPRYEICPRGPYTFQAAIRTMCAMPSTSGASIRTGPISCSPMGQFASCATLLRLLCLLSRRVAAAK
jgi:prepilin-type N-terminal cleavage/methylation domain-containing protein